MEQFILEKKTFFEKNNSKMMKVCKCKATILTKVSQNMLKNTKKTDKVKTVVVIKLSDNPITELLQSQ